MSDLPRRLRELADTLDGDLWNNPITAADDCRSAAVLLDRLRDYVLFDARCPACDDVTCFDGCTFHDDAPVEADKMDAARVALFGIKP